MDICRNSIPKHKINRHILAGEPQIITKFLLPLSNLSYDIRFKENVTAQQILESFNPSKNVETYICALIRHKGSLEKRIDSNIPSS